MVASLVSILALILLAMAAFGLGRPLLRQLDLDGEDSLALGVYSIALGLTAVGAMLLSLHLAGWLYESVIVVFTMLSGCWGMIEICLVWLQSSERGSWAIREVSFDDFRDHATMQPSRRPPRWLALGMAAAVAVIACCTLISALAPPTGDSPLGMQSERSRMLLLDHGLADAATLAGTACKQAVAHRSEECARDPFAAPASFVGLWHAWAMALDGEVCSQLFHWAMGGLLALAVVLLAEPILGYSWAWVAGAVALMSPGVEPPHAVSLDGIPLAAMGTLAIAAWWRATMHGRSRRWLVVAGLTGGTAIAVNWSACLLLVPMAASWLWTWWRQPEQRRILARSAAMMTSLTVVVGGLGSLPMLSAATSPQSAAFAAAWRSFGFEREILDYLGVTLVAAAPGLCLARRLHRLGVIVSMASACILMGHFLNAEAMLLAAIPPASIAAVWVWIEIRRFPPFLLRTAVAAFACMLAATAAVPVVRSGDAIRVAVGLEDREEYLIRREPSFHTNHAPIDPSLVRCANGAVRR